MENGVIILHILYLNVEILKNYGLGSDFFIILQRAPKNVWK